MKDIIIDLNESLDAKELKEEELIHREEFETAKGLITRSLTNIPLKGQKDDFEHETITILGTRGSGKTTFLRSLMNKFRSESKFAVTRLIDPTLIEEKGHIFLTVISAIRLLVDEERWRVMEKNKMGFEDWDSALEKLAQGLPSMDGVGGNILENNWQEPEYILEKGIQSVSAALTLQDDFKDFIEKSLRILGKEYFLIAFDDIDIDFKKGWPVLETIRKYFTSTKIVSILSGDLRFYSLAIRKRHWLNFGKALLINEGEYQNRHGYFDGLVTEMESQYLLKVLKPSRRIHLSTLYEKVVLFRNQVGRHNENPKQILIRVSSERITEILQYYSLVLKDYGIKNQYQAEVYYSFLLRLPLRTQLILLTQFQFGVDIRNSSLIDAFLSDLFEKNINISIIENTPQLLNAEILRMLIKQKALNVSYQLQPNTESSSFNGCLMAMTLLSSKSYSFSYYNIFDYIIKIGLTRNLSSSFKYEDPENESTSYSYPSINGLVWHSSLYQDKVLRDTMGHVNAYLLGAFPGNKKWAGMIPILALQQVAKEGIEKGKDRIDVVFRNEPLKAMIAFMPVSICSYTTKNSSEISFSIFTLFAAVGELIRKAELGDLSRGLAELSQIRVYPIPDFERAISDRQDSVLFNSEPAFGRHFSHEGKLKDIIESWISKRFESSIGPHLLGKITTRFFYALRAIEDNEETDDLGEMMHNRVIAFFNSVVIEEAREIDEDFEGFNNNNTNFSDSIFINNVRSAMHHSRQSFDFSRWLLSCPLLIAYLGRKSKAYNIIQDFIRMEPEFADSEINISDMLSRVSVSRSRQRRNNVELNLTKEEIIEGLKANNIPFSIFKHTSDKMKARENNMLVRQAMSNLFGHAEWTSFKIRSFRKYIQNRGIRW